MPITSFRSLGEFLRRSFTLRQPVPVWQPSHSVRDRCLKGLHDFRKQGRRLPWRPRGNLPVRREAL
jgi:hypothetical protein